MHELREPYVKTLCNFLESCGVSRQELAKTLNVHRTSVWWWAQGTRPIPKAHAKSFAMLGLDQLTALCVSRNPMAAADVVGNWDHELAEMHGVIDDQAQSAARLVSELSLRRPTKLTTEQLQHYYVAAETVKKSLGTLIRRRNAIPEGDIESRFFFDTDPIGHYRQLWQWCGVDLDVA